MLSDIDNSDKMLGESNFDIEESEHIILARRPASISCNASENNEEDPHFNLVIVAILAKIRRVLTPVQIQRAINDAISNQVLP